MKSPPTPAQASSAESQTCPCSTWTLIGYLAAPVLGAVLLAIYLISPDFYLAYVLEKSNREQQFVENFGEAAALVGGLLLLWAAHLIWHGPGDHAGQHRKAALLIALVGVAALFLFAEEVSYGQKYVQWDTPDRYAQYSVETNLHNNKAIPISIQSLGSLFIVTIFFLIPIAWLMRDRFSTILPLELAVASGPAITLVAFGFLWRMWKDIYVATVGKEGEFYTGFLEQLNEHKEMFVALGLFVYGLSSFRRARALRRGGRRSVQA